MKEKSVQELIAEYKALAKRADQRMVRLEKLSDEDNFHGVLNYSYKNAVQDIHYIYGDDVGKKPRFNKSFGSDVNKRKVQEAINAVNRFLSAETSTKKGIVSGLQKRTNTLNQRLGTDLTWQEAGEFFRQYKAKKESKKYGSDTAVRAFALMARGDIDLKEQIQLSRERNKVVGKDEVLHEIAESMAANGLIPSKYLPAGMKTVKKIKKTVKKIQNNRKKSSAKKSTTKRSKK